MHPAESLFEDVYLAHSMLPRSFGMFNQFGNSGRHFQPSWF